MSGQNAIETDVLVIGCGMTGTCMARQLKLAHPELRIMNIDAKTKFDYWVGESTVEAWEDYMTRVLKLGPFLEKNFITKHGLRKFFDSEDKNLKISQMSEFGRSSYHSIPARNLDRKVFDEAMVQMNKELGIDVHLGVKVLFGEQNLKINKEGHKINTSIGPIHCKWLIDASGRNSPIVKLLKLVEPETRHSSLSVWSRVRNANWIDNMGDDEWRKRVNHTIRYNSTSHFMYRGYWFWLIPIDDNIVSIGVELDKTKIDSKLTNAKEFEEFLRQHKCLDELLGDKAEFLDFYALGKLPRCAKQHFSTDRWFLTGMSGLFVDIMGSGTSRIYSEFNRMIGKMIETDIKGDHELLASQAKHFNLYVSSLYEIHFRNLSNYDLFGTFDLWHNYFGAGLSKYFNSQLPNCMTDLQILNNVAEDHKSGCSCSVEEFKKKNIEKGMFTAHIRLAKEFIAFLDERQAYYANNHGQYFDSAFWEERPEIVSKFYKPRNLDTELEVDRRSFYLYCRNLVQRMCELEKIEFNESVFIDAFDNDWDSGQTLSELLEKQKTQKKRPTRHLKAA